MRYENGAEFTAMSNYTISLSRSVIKGGRSNVDVADHPVWHAWHATLTSYDAIRARITNELNTAVSICGGIEGSDPAVVLSFVFDLDTLVMSAKVYRKVRETSLENLCTKLGRITVR